jgi:hypothetical protein
MAGKYYFLSRVFSWSSALSFDGNSKVRYAKKLYKLLLTIHPSKKSKAQVNCRKLFPLFSAIELCSSKK